MWDLIVLIITSSKNQAAPIEMVISDLVRNR